MLRTFAIWLLAHRTAASLLLVALFAMSLGTLRYLRFDFAISSLLVMDGEEDVEAEALAAGIDAESRWVHTIYTLTWPTPIDRPQLDDIQRVSEELEELPTVAWVRSLATARVVKPGSSLPIPRPFPETLRESQSVRDAVAEHPLIVNALLSKDGRSTPLLVRFELPFDDPPLDGHLEQVFDYLTRALDAEIQIRSIGGAVVERAMKTSMWRDVAQNLVLELIFCSLLLALLFRAARGAVLPMSVVLLAIVYSVALLVALGYAITLVDLAVPGLVTIIALCDAVHMLHRFEQAYRETHDRRRSVLDMMQSVGAACFHTSFTTALGFLSLLISSHAAIREFGVKASLSVLVAFCTVVTVLPIALSLWPVHEPSPMQLPGLSKLSYGRPRLTATHRGNRVARPTR